MLPARDDHDACPVRPVARRAARQRVLPHARLLSLPPRLGRKVVDPDVLLSLAAVVGDPMRWSRLLPRATRVGGHRRGELGGGGCGGEEVAGAGS